MTVFRTECPVCGNQIVLHDSFSVGTEVWGTSPDHTNPATGDRCPDSGMQRHRPELRRTTR